MLMIIISFKMSKNEENIYNLSKKSDFEQPKNIETVPYLNNDGDNLQDILNIVENNTNDLQMQLITDNNENVINVDFEN